MAQALEAEVKSLIEDFAIQLGFHDVETMKEAAYQFQVYGDKFDQSSYNSIESDNSNIVSPSQETHTRKSMCTATLLSSDEETDFKPVERKPRKSRKSVCVIPKISMSSSDEDAVDELLRDEEDEDEVLTNRRKKNCNFLESSSEEEENINYTKEKENTPGFTAKTKKKINYLSSSSSSNEEVDDDGVEMLSQSLKIQTLGGKNSDLRNDTNRPDAESSKEIANAGYVSSGDGSDEGSLKDFIVSDDEIEIIDHKGDETESDGDFPNNENDAILNCDINEDKEFNFKTPIPIKQKEVLKENYLQQKFLTPHSQSRRIMNELCTPKSVPGTPAYKREFNKKRDQTVSEFFQLFNKTVFGRQLPTDLQITWNKRMTKTAGYCYYSKSLGVQKCRIELSEKVIDSAERIRDTLIHELCHAATWLINGVQAGHGPSWKNWAKKANVIHPDLPIIARCHQYEIHTKYVYKCNGCGCTFGRHSKSINVSKHRCAKCGGIPELQNDKSSASATPKAPNAYAIFVKENFATIKKGNPSKSHREIMMLISDKFKESKK